MLFANFKVRKLMSVHVHVHSICVNVNSKKRTNSERFYTQPLAGILSLAVCFMMKKRIYLLDFYGGMNYEETK